MRFVINELSDILVGVTIQRQQHPDVSVASVSENLPAVSPGMPATACYDPDQDSITINSVVHTLAAAGDENLLGECTLSMK